jgi:hypothetical protein
LPPSIADRAGKDNLRVARIIFVEGGDGRAAAIAVAERSVRRRKRANAKSFSACYKSRRRCKRLKISRLARIGQKTIFFP